MNKLAKYIIGAAVLAIIVLIVWYFRSIITYILIASPFIPHRQARSQMAFPSEDRKWHIQSPLSTDRHAVHVWEWWPLSSIL